MKQTMPFLLRLFIFDFSSQQRVQILNLPQYQSICNTSSISHLNSSPPSCVMSETLANIKACVHILYALTNATLSANTADCPERTRFCAEPANTHVFTGIRTVVPLLKGRVDFCSDLLNYLLSNVPVLNCQLHLARRKSEGT